MPFSLSAPEQHCVDPKDRDPKHRVRKSIVYDPPRDSLVLLLERLWIVPILISCVALAFAYSLVHHGTLLLTPKAAEGELRWLFSGDASTARWILASLLSGLRQ